MIDEAKPSAVQPAANDQDRASMNALVLPPTVGPMHPLRNASIGKAANAAAGACRIAGRVWTALFRREKPFGDSGPIVAAEFADRLARVEGLLKATRPLCGVHKP